MNGLQAAQANGLVQLGDILLFRNGERGWLNAGIRYAQRRALQDLVPCMSRQDLEFHAAFTHSAQVTSSECFSEQYAPRARCRRFSVVPAGTVILVKRLRDVTPERLEPVLRQWDDVIRRGEPYPVQELVYYWLKWVRKTWLAQRFAEVFRDRRHNVCSGEIVDASRKGGWFTGEAPEAWYPARLAADAFWTETGNRIEV